MRKIIIDVENTTSKLNAKHSDFSPYNPNNKLVSVGWMMLEDNKKVGPIKYLFLHHKDIASYTPQINCNLADLKADMASAEMLVAHNAKYDIQWLEASGFDTKHLKINDSMVMEYVMARGRNDISFKLGELCKKYGLSEKGDIFDKYPGMSVDEIPIQELEDYGKGDIQCTYELYCAQMERLARSDYRILYRTISMMHEFCRTLSNIEANGVKIDLDAMEQVRQEFAEEAEGLKFDINRMIKDVMGDINVNLESPQQLSEIIYSRKIKPGMEDTWIKTFNIGKDERNKNLRRPKMKYPEYTSNVKAMTNIIMKKEAFQCTECKGIGKIQKIKKDGKPFVKPNKCKPCASSGAIYKELNEIAGFKMKPKSIAFTTVSGFSTSSGFLEELVGQAIEENKPNAKEFLEKYMRLNAVSSYLSNFVGGISTFVQFDHILHTNFMQCVTSTGRLSSVKPNLQNQPREGTFPIRKVFVSRWADKGGEIADVDFKQLEFRAAVHLARDENGKRHILEGIDVHNQTKRIITEAGQPIDRQEAKAHTFKPLYAGRSGTDAEQAYYKAFLKDLYPRVGEWHKELQEEAISTKMITIPTGRQFLFPDVERAWHGGANKATQICNFPVQAFATADCCPLGIIRLEKEFKKAELKSLIVLTVHDSVIIDVFPGERVKVIELMKQLAKFTEEELLTRYKITMFVPLDCDVKIGYNLMEVKAA